MIYIIGKKATSEQLTEMQEALKTYIKLAVDIEQQILAGGGVMHADCEAELLKSGSKQENIWGADWYPETKEITFESLINIRPKQNNFSLEVEDVKICKMIETIVRNLLEIIE